MSATPSPRSTVRVSLVVLLMVIGVVVLAVTREWSHPLVQPGLFAFALLLCVFLAYENRIRTEPVTLVSKEKITPRALSPVSEELYTELYKNSPVPYLIIDEAGIVTSGNIAAKRFFGVTKGSVEGMAIFGRLKIDSDEHRDVLIEKYRNGIAVSDELVQITREDGTEAWALYSLFRLVHGTKDQMGLLTLVDITKQKQIENAKTEFVSLASHQLRTPIAGIMWSAELLQLDEEKTLSDRQKKYIERLLSATKRMAVLVDDFLRVSRFELGTFVPQPVAVSVKDLVTDVLAEQAAKLTVKQLTITTNYDETLPLILSDVQLLRMIITNLTTNAVKYTERGGHITISYGQHNHRVRIVVSDDGMGIPAADQDRIFQKLFRASNAAHAIPDGNGLGLYIIKEAVKVLKGTITFVSGEGTGTTFEVLLPLEIPA